MQLIANMRFSGIYKENFHQSALNEIKPNDTPFKIVCLTGKIGRSAMKMRRQVGLKKVRSVQIQGQAYTIANDAYGADCTELSKKLKQAFKVKTGHNIGYLIILFIKSIFSAKARVELDHLFDSLPNFKDVAKQYIEDYQKDYQLGQIDIHSAADIRITAPTKIETSNSSETSAE